MELRNSLLNNFNDNGDNNEKKFKKSGSEYLRDWVGIFQVENSSVEFFREGIHLGGV